MNLENTSEGFTLYQRPPGGRYYMRYSIRGQGQQRASLGTSDAIEAQRRANIRWYKACALAEAGLSVSKKQFERIAEEFIDGIELAVKRGEKAEYHARQYPKVIRKYFCDYFGKRLLSAIKFEDITAYWDWRKEYWITGPGSKHLMIEYKRIIKGRETRIFRPVKEGYPSESTLRKEAILLRHLFEFGRQRGHTTEVPEIVIPRNHMRGTRSRPGFTLEEFIHLTKVSEQRIGEYQVENPEAPLKNQRVGFLPWRWLVFQLITVVAAMIVSFWVPQHGLNLGSLWYVILLPPIIFAVRGGLPAAALATALTTLLTPPAAYLLGFAGERTSLQFLLLITASVSLMIGAAITDRKQAHLRLKQSEEGLEQQV